MGFSRGPVVGADEVVGLNTGDHKPWCVPHEDWEARDSLKAEISQGQRLHGSSVLPCAQLLSPAHHQTSDTGQGRKMQDRKWGEACQQAEKWGMLSGGTAGETLVAATASIRTSGGSGEHLLFKGLKICPSGTLH